MPTYVRPIHSTWNVALYKIFKLKNLSNLYHVQYFMGTLPVNCDLRTLNCASEVVLIIAALLVLKCKEL